MKLCKSGQFEEVLDLELHLHLYGLRHLVVITSVEHPVLSILVFERGGQMPLAVQRSDADHEPAAVRA
ncbi:hypothetical protein [Deinococcus rubellus]|uniref:hypothetical protein n=1 Tax=Deinococcus rubellus TaxID=1889240 RepID=UPI0031E602DC